MGVRPFKKLFARIDSATAGRKRSIEDRVHALESDVRDLRSLLRELVEVLETELGRDLDRDQKIGHVSPRRGLPKTARLAPVLPPSRARKPKPLPPAYP